ncbi:MFS transporter, partial [Escherichia coli]|nr:MFS transporter [Escherichia coli]
GFGAIPALVIIAIRSRYMSESPVWAANQGNLREAASILRQAYNINAHVAQDALEKPAPKVRSAQWSNYLRLFRGVYLRRTTLST